MRQDFSDVLWTSFKSVYGPVLTLSAFFLPLVLAFLFWYFSPSDRIPIWLALLIDTVGLILLSALLILVLTLYGASRDLYKASGKQLPKVIRAMDTSTIVEAAEVMCLLEPSELFSHDFVVSFHRINEEGFEILIGLGYVLTIRDDGRIQVAMTELVGANRDFVAQLKTNNIKALEDTRVKPSAPQKHTYPRPEVAYIDNVEDMEDEDERFDTP